MSTAKHKQRAVINDLDRPTADRVQARQMQKLKGCAIATAALHGVPVVETVDDEGRHLAVVRGRVGLRGGAVGGLGHGFVIPFEAQTIQV